MTIAESGTNQLLLPLGLSTLLLEEDFTEIATDENHLVSFDTFGIYWISASFAVKQLRNKLMFFTTLALRQVFATS